MYRLHHHIVPTSPNVLMLTSTFALLALALAAAAAPPVVVDKLPISLALTRRLKAGGSMKQLADTDRARARVLQSLGKGTSKTSKRSVFPVSLTNEVVSYSVSVGVGTPPTYHDLLLDTGSSLTWVGAITPYNETSSSVDIGEPLEAEYGAGTFTGRAFQDTVTLGNLVVQKQFIGVADPGTIMPDGLDGILGMGPTDLNADLSLDDPSPSPTVTDNAFAQGLLDTYEIGIQFHPTTSDNGTVDGMLTFGGTNSSALNGTITTVPLTSTTPSSSFVGIDQSITYGTSGATILESTAGITDTGTALILLASDAFRKYMKATGATMDDVETGLLKLPASQYDNLQSLFFNIGGQTFEFTKNAQIFPRSLNTDIGGDADSVYLIVGDLGTPSGEGLDFINGYAFMQRFYTVYNTQDSSFGIANTPFTFAEIN
ncbi:A1 family peptidase [Phanerochaete sordida]|uniref:A1 family peptidase n=1 Tax=Phanerochaete sordida TaxID=48140 RepID=A0A9P3GG83_9APHY|nr:A1 family peptidase [Phanerochaete sordida]